MTILNYFLAVVVGHLLGSIMVLLVVNRCIRSKPKLTDSERSTSVDTVTNRPGKQDMDSN